MRSGLGVEEIFELTSIDRWFLNNIKEIIDMEMEIVGAVGADGDIEPALLRRAKEAGFSFEMLATLSGGSYESVKEAAVKAGITPVFKTVDTCGAEFEAFTPYLYSTYERPFYNIADKGSVKADCEAAPTENKKVMILGSARTG